MSATVYEFEYSLDAAECLDLLVDLRETDGTLATRRQHHRNHGRAYLFSLILPLLPLSLGSVGSFIWVIVFCGLAGRAYVRFQNASSPRLRAEVRTEFEAVIEKLTRSACRVRLKSSGLEFPLSRECPHVGWADVSAVHTGLLGLSFLDASSQVVLLLPYRLVSPSSLRQIQRDIREWHDKHQPEHADVIRSYLRKVFIPCPRCSYNLHALEKLVCPECGVLLTRDNMPDAFCRD